MQSATCQPGEFRLKCAFNSSREFHTVTFSSPIRPAAKRPFTCPVRKGKARAEEEKGLLELSAGHEGACRSVQALAGEELG